MPKRLTFEQAKKAFEDAGYELLENTYKNAHTKMKYRCPFHPKAENYMNINKLKSGQRCNLCIGRTDYTFDEVFDEFKKAGYELLEKEYKNMNIKMKYKCPVHPDRETTISFAKLKKGNGCPYCAKNAKYTFDEVKKFFDERGLVLLEEKYINARTPMRYTCPNHPNKETKIRVHELLRGVKCRWCDGQGEYTIDEARELFLEKRGYELLEEEYINAKTPMRYKCPSHPDKETKTTLDRLINRGGGCYHCHREWYRGENTSNWKGGTTELRSFLRERINEWRVKWFSYYDGKCAVTGGRDSLEVHHLEPFHQILDKIMYELDLPILDKINEYEPETLELIAKTLLDYHMQHVEGVAIEREIHILYHKVYGKEDGNKEMFDEFVKRYKNGEFR
jgi:hypothetical protein